MRIPDHLSLRTTGESPHGGTYAQLTRAGTVRTTVPSPFDVGVVEVSILTPGQQLLLWDRVPQGDPRIYLYDAYVGPSIAVDLYSILTENAVPAGRYNIRLSFDKTLTEEFGLTLKHISGTRQEVHVVGDDARASELMQALRKKDLLLNFANGVRVGITFGVDAYSRGAVLRLDTPLPATIEKDAVCWICESIADDYFVSTFLVNNANREVPYVILNPGRRVGKYTVDTNVMSMNDILSSSLHTTASQYMLETAISRSRYKRIGVHDLDIDYASHADFVKFSSAYDRIRIFKQKIETIETYASASEALGTSSYYDTGTRLRYASASADLVANFDGYEVYLYNSNTEYAWPKTNSVLYSSTSSIVQTWLTESMQTASLFDQLNQDGVLHNVPAFIIDDPTNESAVAMLSSMGHHFDNLWAYTKGLNIANTTDTPFRHHDGMWHIAKSYGVNLANPGISSELWDYVFGMTGSNRSPAQKDTHLLWSRINQGIPTLLKAKGTTRAIHSLISAYGIPSDFISIQTPQVGTGPWLFEMAEDDFALGTTSTTSVTFPWDTGAAAASIRFRLKSDAPLETTTIFEAPGWAIVLDPTGSNGYANVKVEFDDTATQLSSSVIPLFTGDEKFYTCVVGRSASLYTLDVLLVNGPNIIIHQTCSVAISHALDNDFTASGMVTLGAFRGSIDYVRVWSSSLNTQGIQAQALYPASLATGQLGVTGSLYINLPFNSPRNHVTTASITNLGNIPGTTATASVTGFNATSYPFNYEAYGEYRYVNTSLWVDIGELISATGTGSYASASFQNSTVAIGVSPSHHFNKALIKNYGGLDIERAISDPRDAFKSTYFALDKLHRHSLVDTPEFSQYIDLIKAVDPSLLKLAGEFVPARARYMSGFLLSPTILNRSKYKWQRADVESLHYEGTVTPTSSLVADYIPNYEGSLTVGTNMLYSEMRYNLSSSLRMFDYYSASVTLGYTIARPISDWELTGSYTYTGSRDYSDRHFKFTRTHYPYKSAVQTSTTTRDRGPVVVTTYDADRDIKVRPNDDNGPYVKRV